MKPEMLEMPTTMMTKMTISVLISCRRVVQFVHLMPELYSNYSWVEIQVMLPSEPLVIFYATFSN